MGNRVDIIALIDIDTPMPVKQCLERCDRGFRVEQASNMVAFRRLILSKKFDCIISMMESPCVGDVICFQLTHHPPIPVVLFPLGDLAHHRRKVEFMKTLQNTGHGAPAVIIRGEDIYLRGVDGKDAYWGGEGPESEELGKAMELEFKAIDYVRDRLELYLSDIAPEHVSDIVYEGYRKLFLWFRDLDVALGHREGN